ncbi:HicB-like protein involved in pilus formation [Actinomycetospora succinea]|uniref:HicB-like protein involved in pilus formation n=1 Tax=Actinomycetospora succinea TaxID=663603 RepID=A0A4R6UMC0_9PSEU|nr:toxin-antitoxin system HicB family antitoxin [Actinomycetospora succinea]TDQ47336.1 HicB-like protein involved in pilus formation [Actinomycetospora succinea]
MQLNVYVDRLREEFAAAAEAAGDDVRDVAERLVTPLDAATRLVLLEALAAATEEITLDLAPGSVHLRLRGRDPDFVVAPAVERAPEPSAEPETHDGPSARVNFRPPESLKARIEEAAARDGLSVNTWLVRAATAALGTRADATPRSTTPTTSGRAGWFG